MRIYVDADACPVVSIVEQVARQYNIPVTLLTDTNHVLSSDYSDVKVIGAVADAVDFALISMLEKDANDIVFTQDYGVAAMALGKNAFAIHQSGKWYTNENIDQMLMERHLAKKPRRGKSKNHLKGPKKRIEVDDMRFKESFEKMVRKVLNM
ncbi:MAG: YaiI/YqxD family protein [Lachnospiraceae bacterium]|nr:YaiI/YqxD family protein [Lachnospiraceae bacterium]